MKLNVLFFSVALALALALSACANLPPAKDPLRQPAVLLREVLAEWITMYRTAQKNPAELLRYLHDYVAFMSERKKESFILDSLSSAEIVHLTRRRYLLDLLGDTAGADIIPALEEFIAQRTAQDDAMTRYDVTAAKLTIERILLRAQGKDVYISAMLDWVRNGDKTYPGSLNDKGQPTGEGKERVLQGA